MTYSPHSLIKLVFLEFLLGAGCWALGQAVGRVDGAKRKGHAGWPLHLGQDWGVHLGVTLIGEEDS